MKSARAAAAARARERAAVARRRRRRGATLERDDERTCPDRRARATVRRTSTGRRARPWPTATAHDDERSRTMIAAPGARTRRSAGECVVERERLAPAAAASKTPPPARRRPSGARLRCGPARRQRYRRQRRRRRRRHRPPMLERTIETQRSAASRSSRVRTSAQTPPPLDEPERLIPALDSSRWRAPERARAVRGGGAPPRAAWPRRR